MTLTRFAAPVLPALVALVALVALATSPLARADECAAATAAAKTSLTALQQLQHAQPAGAHGDDADVAPAVVKALVAFKQSFVDAADARMACAPENADAAALKQSLAKDFHFTPSDKAPADGGPVYGTLDTIDVRRDIAVSTMPMLLVRVGFGIACGDDNVLLGYVWRGGRWSRAVRWQSGEYKTIDGAFGDYIDYLRLPDGHLVLAHGTPWCTSRWSGFAVDVVAPSKAQQQTVFHFQHGYLRDEDPPALKATADGFEVRTQVVSLDTDLMQRRGIFRFHVDGDTVSRVQPVASNGRDFVDEWLQTDDSSAREWTAPAAADSALAERTKLLALSKKRELGMSYGAVRSCSNNAQYQVELQLNTDTADLAARHFAVIHQERNGFTLVSLGTSANAQCHGADLMAGKHS